MGIGANSYTVDLTLVPAGASNRIDLEIAGTILGSTDSDSDTADVTGNILIEIGAVIDAGTMEIESVETLEFTGGRVVFDDMSYGLQWFLIGNLDVDSSDIGATFDTPDPPKPVTGGTFNAADHVLILNEGQFSAEGSGLLGGFLPENPYILNLSDEPLEVATEATGSITVSSPTIEGDQAWYDVTLTLPVEINEVVFEEPGTAVVSARGTATLEAQGRFSQSLPNFGAVVPPIATGFEQAAAGSTAFARSAGETELEWTMEALSVSVVASVDESFVDPGDPANLHQFHVNNAEVIMLTEPVDVRAEGSVRVSLDLRTWDTSSGFEPEDDLDVRIQIGYDGINFDEELSWLSLAGAELTALNGGRDGSFTTYTTPADLIPPEAKSIRLVVDVENNSNNEHVIWDNLRVDLVSETSFIRGDSNTDETMNIADAIYILSYLFASGPGISCLDAADANDDGGVDLADGVYILQNLFASGPAISPPSPDCGIDPTEDELGCLEYLPCEPLP